jgi:hypothetical protein
MDPDRMAEQTPLALGGMKRQGGNGRGDGSVDKDPKVVRMSL